MTIPIPYVITPGGRDYDLVFGFGNVRVVAYHRIDGHTIPLIGRGVDLMTALDACNLLVRLAEENL